MHLGLSMTCDLHFEQKCRICGENMQEHAHGCPQGIIQEILEKRDIIRCPVCRKIKVEINTEDFYECRSCHAQFSRSYICGPNAAEQLKDAYLFLNTGEAIRVKIMKDKGKGKFLHDRYLKQFTKLRSRAMKIISQRDKRRLEREKAKEARLEKLFENVKKQMTGNWQV